MTTTRLIRIDIRRERNEHGERSFAVTPVYRLRCGRVVSEWFRTRTLRRAAGVPG